MIYTATATYMWMTMLKTDCQIHEKMKHPYQRPQYEIEENT